MDRSRDGRRASLSSTPRRPRSSGLKDCSVVDDDDIMEDVHNSRLRERSKKEVSGMSLLPGVFSSSSMSGSRNKRRRQITHKFHPQSRATPREEMDETTEDTGMGFSEDDDDLPPPTIPRRNGKLRLHGKILDDGNAVAMSAVPRKARTAVTKRPHEFAPTLARDSERHQSPVAAGAPPSNARISTPSPPSSTSKQTKRTKPNGTKLRASKLAKVSTTSAISEREVEVAEALFDLARMVTNQASPSFSEGKVDGIPERTHPLQSSPPASETSPAFSPVLAQAGTPISTPQVSSPAPVSTGVSGPPGSSNPATVVVPASAEAPKRKRPRARVKAEDGWTAHCQPRTISTGGSILEPKVDIDHNIQSAGSNRAQVKVEANQTGSNGSTSLGNAASLHIPAPSPPPLSSQFLPPSEIDSLAKGDKKSSTAADYEDPASASSGESKTVLAKASSPADIKPLQQETADEGKLLDARNPLTKLERGKSSPRISAMCATHHSKYEIDLMAPPKASASGTSEKTGNSLESVALELNEKIQEDPNDGTMKGDQLAKEAVKDERDDVESRMSYSNSRMAGKGLESSMEDLKMDHARHHEVVKQGDSKETEREKGKVEDSKQAPSLTIKEVKSELNLQQRTDRSVSPFPMTCPPASRSGMASPSLPISMGMAGWPGSLPQMGYYSPAVAAAAAAAWPASSAISGAASVDKNSPLVLQVPPFAFPGARLPCKRCATHVYAAHFIDAQHQMRRHPLWAATFGNPGASRYPMKSYNLSIPLPPDAVIGNGASSLTGISTGVGNRSSSLVADSHNERDISTSTTQGSKEKGALYMDRSKTMPPLVQAGQHQQALPFQAGQGAAFGYPVTQPTPSSMCSGSPIMGLGNTEGGDSNTSVSCGLGEGTAAVVVSCSGPVVRSASSSSDGNVVSAAAAQLQAMIQQAFPFSFPPGLFGPSFNTSTGCITQQQATQFFGNPFYNTHSVHPPMQSQQGPSAAGSSTSGMSSLQKKQLNLQQGACLIQSGSLQQQQQHHHTPSASPSQPQQRAASHGSREGNMGGEILAPPEGKYPSFSKNMFNQVLPNMPVPTMSSSSVPGMPALPAHDFSLVDVFSGKQAGNGKLPNQYQQPSAQMQAQQKGMVSTQIQHHLISQYHDPNSALQTSLKSKDPQMSQPFSSMPMGVMNRSSLGPGPLGLAPVAAVMAPEGHAVLQTMSEIGRGHAHARQEHLHQQHRNRPMVKAGSSIMEESLSSIEESSYSSSSHGLDGLDNKRTPVKRALAPGGTSKMDLQASPNMQGSPPANNGGGQVPLPMSGNTGASFNIMSSPAGFISSRQMGALPVGCLSAPTLSPSQSLKPAMGRVKGMANVTGAAGDSTSSPFSDRSLAGPLNKIPALGVPFHGQSVSGNTENTRQGQAGGQHSSQLNPVPRMQLGTAPVSTAPNTMAIGMFASAPITKHQGQPGRGQQPALNAMLGPRLSSAMSTSSIGGSLPLPPLPPVSKSSSGTILKNIPPAKNNLHHSQKQSGATSAKRSGPVTQSSTSSFGPSSVPSKVGQSQSQQQQQQHQQVQQNFQQQQHYRLQHHQLQQQQQFAQSMQQQVHLASGQQTMTLQFHQPLTNRVAPHGASKQSVQPQLQMKQQQFLQQQQQQQSLRQVQSHSLADQQPMPYLTQQQSGQPVQQHSTLSVTQPSQQHSYPQQQSGTDGKTVSSDGVSNPVSGSRSVSNVKPGNPGGPPVSNVQRNNNSSPNFLHPQIAAGSTYSSLQPLCAIGTNANSLSYLHSDSLSSSAGKLVNENVLTGAAFSQLPPHTSSIMGVNYSASSLHPQSGMTGFTPQATLSSIDSNCTFAYAANASQHGSDTKIALFTSAEMHKGIINANPHPPVTSGQSLKVTTTAAKMAESNSPSGSAVSRGNLASVATSESKGPF